MVKNLVVAGIRTEQRIKVRHDLREPWRNNLLLWLTSRPCTGVRGVDHFSVCFADAAVLRGCFPASSKASPHRGHTFHALKLVFS